MFGRSKSQAVLEKVNSTGEAVSELASSARDAAAPIVRGAAATASDKLSDAAERAATLLADAAERLADAAPDGRLSDASQSVADSVRPKGRSKFKTLLVVAATAGGVVAFLRSPLAARLRQRFFGAPDQDLDDEAESITLPAETSPPPSSSTPSASPPAAAAGIHDDVSDAGGVNSPAGNGSQATSPKKSAPAPRPAEGG